ncbi:MAG: hypothetical protein ACTSQ5_12980 [Promethearchaeota archaeon]
MSCITPIFASQNQEVNNNEEEAFQRKKKISIMISIFSVMAFLGLYYYSGGYIFSNIPLIFIMISIFSLIRVISLRSRSRSRRRSQNYPQRQRMEPYPSEYKPTTIKRNQNYCLQCGSKIDRNDLNSVSVYYCSHCGNEIKNDRA